MNKKCPKCKKEYRLGYEGVCNGCDKCLGIERIADIGSNHSAWERGEKYHDYMDVKTGKVTRVTREQAREQARIVSIILDIL
jgi:hypothetical protein